GAADELLGELPRPLDPDRDRAGVAEQQRELAVGRRRGRDRLVREVERGLELRAAVDRHHAPRPERVQPGAPAGDVEAPPAPPAVVAPEPAPARGERGDLELDERDRRGHRYGPTGGTGTTGVPRGASSRVSARPSRTAISIVPAEPT